MSLVVKSDGCTAEYTFTGEGHTLGNALARRLLERPGVQFAAYNVPHPLEDKMIVTLYAEESASDEVQGALESLVTDVQTCRKAFLKAASKK